MTSQGDYVLSLQGSISEYGLLQPSQAVIVIDGIQTWLSYGICKGPGKDVVASYALGIGSCRYAAYNESKQHNDGAEE